MQALKKFNPSAVAGASFLLFTPQTTDAALIATNGEILQGGVGIGLRIDEAANEADTNIIYIRTTGFNAISGDTLTYEALFDINQVNDAGSSDVFFLSDTALLYGNIEIGDGSNNSSFDISESEFFIQNGNSTDQLAFVSRNNFTTVQLGSVAEPNAVTLAFTGSTTAISSTDPRDTINAAQDSLFPSTFSGIADSNNITQQFTVSESEITFVTISPIPEPSTTLILGAAAMLGLGIRKRPGIERNL